jgi:hypothetical protein
MLPLLPAILLLLMQGPAGLERLARDGRLPASLESWRQAPGQASTRIRTSDPRIAQVLVSLLQEAQPSQTVQKPEPILERKVAIPPAPVLGQARKGYDQVEKSRDGPR